MNDRPRQRVLVAYASRHGATAEIAEHLGEVLRRGTIDVHVSAVDRVRSLHEYDAVILGSAVYAGRWPRGARRFVDDNQVELRSRSVWLFSSGPLGSEPAPEHDPMHLSTLVEQSGATEHRVFEGRLDPSRLSLAERAVTRMVRAPSGDFRDWAAIGGWAEEIAERLGATIDTPGASQSS